MENEAKKQNQRKAGTASRRRKPRDAEYDAYVMNVSNGLNPPSRTAKRRRKKKPDAEAYDRYLEREAPDWREFSAEAEPAAPRGAAGKPRARKPGSPRRRDGYDDYLRLAEQSDALLPRAVGEVGESGRRPVGRAQRRRRRSRARSAIYVAAMACVLVGFLAFGWKQVNQYRDFRAMRAVVDNQGFYDGTTVDGVDVSGMTLTQAMAYFQASVEPMYANRSVALSTGEVLLAQQLGYSSDYAQALRSAWSSGRSGTLAQRYAAIASGVQAAGDYAVTRTLCAEGAVRQVVSEMGQRIRQDASEPQVTGFDVDTRQFTFTEGQPGLVLDEERLVSDIQYVMERGGGDVEVIINAIQPSVTVDQIRAQYGQISFISTSAASSNANRLTNLRLACEAIDGYRLEPGAEFSFNQVVGRRTEEKGYKVAGVYSSGAAATGIGGGVCQVGSTLFNAAVMADMTVTDRQPHSLPVSYLDRGRDAAINWPNKDLKFVNETDSPVYIAARLTSDKQVECAVYGKYLPDGRTIQIASRTTSTVNPETVTKLDPSLPHGASETKEGHKGYKATAWKVVLDASGNEISREVLCYSTYKKKDTVIYYNP